MAQPRVLAGVNFEPKRVRKARRKALVRARGFVPNLMADIRNEAADRAEFYRNLRLMKLRRRQIAKELAELVPLVGALRRGIIRLDDRMPDLDAGVVADAHSMVRTAEGAVATVADEYHAFSRRRIYYVKELAA